LLHDQDEAQHPDPPNGTHDPAPNDGRAEPSNPIGNANTGNPRPTAKRPASADPREDGDAKNNTQPAEA
jgi:hypothetical protein